MSDLSELEGRITAALERVGRGIEALSKQPEVPALDEAEVTRLKEALEAEKAANDQLEERLRAVHDKHEGYLASLGARAGEAEAEVERLRKVNAKLRQTNRALRAANAEGLGDASLINDAMAAELDALRALRDSDRAELDGLIAELTPLTEERANA
jgi:chromosome segregation ATPase